MASTELTRARQEVAAWHPGQIWQPPSKGQRWTDVAFRKLCFGFAGLTVLLVIFLVVEIGVQAIPAFKEYGLKFLSGTTWDSSKQVYGILPEIWGTLYTSLLALFFGTLFGVAAAIFLSEALLIDGGWAIAAARARHVLASHGRLRNRLAGSFLIGAGAALALTRGK